MAKSQLELSAETGKWDAGLKKAQQALNDFVKNAGGMEGAMKKNGEAVTKFVDMLGSIESTATNPSRQLREMTNTIADLTTRYQSLTQEEKSSPFGKAMASSIEQLTNRAGTLKDVMDDTNQAIKNVATDTQFTDGMNLMASTVGNCLTAVAGLAGGSEEATKVLKDMATIQATIRAVESLTKAFQRQNLVLLKNPYVAVTAAVVALGYALTKLAGEQQKVNEAEKAMNEARSEGLKSVQEELTRLDLLNERLHDNSLSVSERKTALEAIQDIVPEYHASLSEEGQLLDDNSAALDRYRDHLVDAAVAQAAFSKLVKENEQLIDLKAEADRLRNQIRSTSDGAAIGSSGVAGYTLTQTAGEMTRGRLKDKLAEVERKQAAAQARIDALSSQVGTETLAGSKTSKKTSTSTTSRHSSGTSHSTRVRTSGGSTTKPKGFISDMEVYDPGKIEFPEFTGFTESMNSLQSSLSAAQEQLLNTTDPVLEAKLQSIIDNLQAKIDAQPLALKLGVSAETAVGIEKGLNDMRTKMAADLKKSSEELNASLASQTGTTLVKTAKDTQGAWSAAASSISSLGDVMQSVNDKGTNVAGIVLQAIANVALGFAQSLKGTFNPWEFIAAAVAGVATMATTIAAIKKNTSGSYAEGGMVPGHYNGGVDSTYVYASPGEVILNRAQQSNLLGQLDGGGASNARTTISGEQIVTVVNAYGRRSGRGEILK